MQSSAERCRRRKGGVVPTPAPDEPRRNVRRARPAPPPPCRAGSCSRAACCSPSAAPPPRHTHGSGPSPEALPACQPDPSSHPDASPRRRQANLVQALGELDDERLATLPQHALVAQRLDRRPRLLLRGEGHEATTCHAHDRRYFWAGPGDPSGRVGAMLEAADSPFEARVVLSRMIVMSSITPYASNVGRSCSAVKCCGTCADRKVAGDGRDPETWLALRKGLDSGGACDAPFSGLGAPGPQTA